jgi:light-regulated signal transduction histidine kinase (bacteriophytochrome)
LEIFPASLPIGVLAPDEGEALIVFKDDGLGLWIAKVEAESHGGTIDVRSDEGKGLGVYITLPAIKEEDNAGSAARPFLES